MILKSGLFSPLGKLSSRKLQKTIFEEMRLKKKWACEQRLYVYPS